MQEVAVHANVALVRHLDLDHVVSGRILFPIKNELNSNEFRTFQHEVRQEVWHEMEAPVIVVLGQRPVHHDHDVSIFFSFCWNNSTISIQFPLINVRFLIQHAHHQPVTEELLQWWKAVVVLVQTVAVIQSRQNAQFHAQEAARDVHGPDLSTTKVTIKRKYLALWLKFRSAILQHPHTTHNIIMS